jgi:hypothetical protein
MTNILITIISTFIGLNGLLYKPVKDHSKPLKWSNINWLGKIMFFSIIILCLLSVYQTNHRIKLTEEQAKVQDDYKEYLTKISSKCEGYTVIIRGTIDFSSGPTESAVRNSLTGIFGYTGELHIKAINKYGEYSCSIFPKDVNIRRFLNLSYRAPKSDFIKAFMSDKFKNPFFYEISCSNIRPINSEGLLFAKHGDSSIQYFFEEKNNEKDLKLKNGIKEIVVKELIFDDSPPIPPLTLFTL